MQTTSTHKFELQYKKRGYHIKSGHNPPLFRKMKNICQIEQIQNYIPLYGRLFALTTKNCNTISLNHPLYITDVISEIVLPESDLESLSRSESGSESECEVECSNMYNIRCKSETGPSVVKKAFIKTAPLLDPYMYMTGKYDIENKQLFHLPTYPTDTHHTHTKVLEKNNSAYIDGFFAYLSSMVKNQYGFVHGIDFYGSFLGIKRGFVTDVTDDIHYLTESDFFKSHLDDLFDPYFNFDQVCKDIEEDEQERGSTRSDTPHPRSLVIDDDDIILAFKPEILDDISTDSPALFTSDPLIMPSDDIDEPIELHARSSASSKSSNTTYWSDDDSAEDNDSVEDDEVSRSISNGDSDGDSDSDEEEEVLKVAIDAFPVHIICTELCDGTMDDYIMCTDNSIEDVEYSSMFMQIIMILGAYQKMFHLTHNDLHTNNIMFTNTLMPFLYYKWKGKTYKVPTYGKIYKIIDFGRAIFSFQGQRFCSDDFDIGNDAYTQYNTEPFFNTSKPRIEPNYSFDLSRLGCALTDCLAYRQEVYTRDHKDEKKCKITPNAARISDEWCTDDKGRHMLYKSNGEERYTDFKLYKMIARLVHAHTPDAQLTRPEFEAFCIDTAATPLPSGAYLMNLDAMPDMTMA